MKGKIKPPSNKIMLLLLISIITTTSIIINAKAQQTALLILPPFVTISEPGETVTVDLNITGAVNLYAYEVKIYYLNSIVNATGAVRPPGHFMEPVIDPANQFIPKWEIKNNFNATHGQIWLGFTLLAPEAARSGSGILVKITFKGLAIGTTPVTIIYPGYQYPAKLADNTGAPVPNTAQNGTIEVVPEFPTAAITMITLLAITVTFILQKKRKVKVQH
ncbi:MAG: cohesin domain-containing protein [Candidatus Bathyarchaeia archaeon]